MREIKFKVWKKHTKEMLDDVGGFFVNDLNKNGFVPLQYTGIKDKNGKEIYEGDILRINDGTTYQVKYEQTTEENTLTFVSVWSGFKFGRAGEFIQECEIVSSVYEQPELLK